MIDSAQRDWSGSERAGGAPQVCKAKAGADVLNSRGGRKERKEGNGETWKENPERPRGRGVFGARPREARGLTDIARAT
jgi:hypothetical protein